MENCGACCKSVGQTGLVPTKPDSQECLYLVDNKCSVYANRPSFCSVTSTWRFKEKPNGVTKLEFYKKVNTSCNKYMDAIGLPKEMRIDVEKVYLKQKESVK